MNNIEKLRDFILDDAINPLEQLMGNKHVEAVNLYEKYFLHGGYPPKDSVYTSMLHTLMVPYYEKYLYGDIRLCCAGNQLESIRWKMEFIISDDNLFGSWVSEQNLIAAAEGWGDNLKSFEKEDKRIYRFFKVLEVVFESDCKQDWARLSNELKEMLFKSEVCYDYKTDEVLCVLHAFAMIMQQEWPKEKKLEVFNLLHQHWLFLKHYYSVMTRHIIGVKWTKFSDVAKTVLESSAAFKPHMHIFYCGLLDCVDELHLDRRHQREIDKIIAQMLEELNRVKEHSKILYELCDTLFPEDFQRLLREHRPKSYKEVEDESQQKDELIKQIRQQNQHLTSELEKAKDVLQQMVLSSIPIEEIDAELMKYPPATAFDLLRELNNSVVLSMLEVWREHYPGLLEKYRNRLFEPIDEQRDLTAAMKKVAERPTFGTYYGKGSVHDDKRRQLTVGEIEKKYQQLKRMSNE